MSPLYESYKDSCDNKYKSCSRLKLIRVISKYVNFSIYHTAETLFWALFGLIDLSHFTLKVRFLTAFFKSISFLGTTHLNGMDRTNDFRQLFVLLNYRAFEYAYRYFPLNYKIRKFYLQL